ncbi:arginine-glutamic acid dipeptide repeats protein [Vigna radiata var. radiata]|uniref:Arginine-glutamic acid dipeptide repeats protein n=1 Tax=Vigna radiata var. radiata TaxID=3916 RepID=A0A1S3VFY3_VIGRR|nr:arginine-glutamic acid dipeptide repeats protein [Vigna radiata var. radiata]
MNTTPFMDKQIMDLTHGSSTAQQHSKDFIDLMKHEPPQQQNHHREEDDDEEEEENARGNGINKDDIIPSYDFQPIRPLASSSYDSAPNFGAAFSRPWNSDSNSKNYSSLDSLEPAKVIVEKDRSASDASMLSDIDRTMKKHMDNMLNVLEGVSARLTQLETRTHHLENSVDDLKVSVGNNHGSTDGKLRQLENILREVQSGVLTIKDKQDIMQAQLQLAKLQVSNTNQKSEAQSNTTTDPVQQAVPAPVQSQPQLPTPANLPQSIPVIPPPNAPPQPPPQQSLPPPPQVQLPSQFPPNQIQAAPPRDPYFPAPVQSQETPNQQYQLPLSQHTHPAAAPTPHQQYQQTPHPQYPQPPPHVPQQQPPPHVPQQQPPSHPSMNPSQLQPPLGHHVEEQPPYPPQNYPPNVRQPPSQSPTGPPPPQQFYGAPSHSYEPPSSRPSSGYSSGYGSLSGSGPAEQYRYGGPPQYGGNPALKPPQLPTASVSPSGGSGYPQLPTARILPQALPTASAVSGSSGSAGTGGRVSVDDVVDKVANMGFPRDHVRATVRKLTENGQSVDLNAVLDKLMNDGEVQPPRSWFGR